MEINIERSPQHWCPSGARTRSLFAEQAKRRGAFLPLMCVNISLYFSVQPRFHDYSIFCRKQSRYPLPAGISWSNDVETTSIYVYTTLFQRRLTMVAMISTLLFQINIFERYSRSKIKNDRNFLLRFRHCCWTININDDINYCSTILHVKVIRTKYAEVSKYTEEGSSYKVKHTVS